MRQPHAGPGPPRERLIVADRRAAPTSAFGGGGREGHSPAAPYSFVGSMAPGPCLWRLELAVQSGVSSNRPSRAARRGRLRVLNLMTRSAAGVPDLHGRERGYLDL